MSQCKINNSRPGKEREVGSPSQGAPPPGPNLAGGGGGERSWEIWWGCLLFLPQLGSGQGISLWTNGQTPLKALPSHVLCTWSVTNVSYTAIIIYLKNSSLTKTSLKEGKARKLFTWYWKKLIKIDDPSSIRSKFWFWYSRNKSLKWNIKS